MRFYDIHRHHNFEKGGAHCSCSSIFDLSSPKLLLSEKLWQFRFYSCGVHPWHSELSDEEMMKVFEIATNRQIVAIGEVGLDRLKGPSLETQIAVLKKQIALSEKQSKPIIIHCVRAWQELIKVKRESDTLRPWIIHGYRGKPELTKQLLREGFYFSVGEIFNPDSLRLIPLNSLFCETDESEMTIEEVYLQVSKALNIDIVKFVEKIAQNVQNIFPTVNPPIPD